jgi:hypothetical protein
MHLSSRWRLGLAALLAAGLFAGCGKKTTSDSDGSGGGRVHNPLLQQPQPGAGGLRRMADRPKVRNDLSQLALDYINYQSGTNSPTLEGFKAFIKQDAPQLCKALDDGLYVLVVTRNPSSANVLLYEKVPDADGLQIVAMGDRSVKTLTAQELQEALKKPGG